MTTAPQLIDITLIDSHPLNPRPVITEEDVSDLVSMMGSDYSPSHAIRVRQIGDRYQIIGGHRRTAAARIKGHTHIWCNVEIMGQEKAFMELVRDNAQRELDPIYIGIHAHLALDVAEKGEGMKGGVAEYARLIGRDRGAVSRLRAAGEVAKKACHVTRFPDGVSRQLYEISRLPEPCWQESCDWMLGLTADQRREGMGTVKDVSSRVSCAMSLELPESILGTGKELTARMEVFHGKESKWTAKAIEPTAEIQPAIAEVEPIAEDDSDAVDSVVTASEPMTIERASQSRSHGFASSDDLVHAFSDRGAVAASRELQRGSGTDVGCSLDDRGGYCDDADVDLHSQADIVDHLLRGCPGLQTVEIIAEVFRMLAPSMQKRLVSCVLDDADEWVASHAAASLEWRTRSIDERRYRESDDHGRAMIDARSDASDAVSFSLSDDGIVADWCEFISDDARTGVIAAFANSITPDELDYFNSCVVDTEDSEQGASASEPAETSVW